MIKNGAFRRIIIASLALFIVLLTIYIFPKNEVKIDEKTIYKKVNTSAIYLIDQDNYVGRTLINISSEDKISIANELLNALINGTNKNKYIQNGFKTYINSDVRINSVKIDEDTIEVDFSEEFIESLKLNEERILESIVYTLTEIKGINKVKIYIDGNLLDKLPSSGKYINNPLDRKIGINKVYHTSNIKNTQDVTVYFIKNINDNNYFVPVTITTNDNNEKIEIIIKELTGQDNIDLNLSSYITQSVKLTNYKILDDKINIEFSNDIFNSLGKIDEEVLYGISLSIYDNYNISKVNFYVNNKEITAFALINPWKITNSGI